LLKVNQQKASPPEEGSEPTLVRNPVHDSEPSAWSNPIEKSEPFDGSKPMLKSEPIGVRITKNKQ